MRFWSRRRGLLLGGGVSRVGGEKLYPQRWQQELISGMGGGEWARLLRKSRLSKICGATTIAMDDIDDGMEVWLALRMEFFLIYDLCMDG